MPTQDFEVNLPQELHLWAVRVFQRIKRKFVDMEINMSVNKKEEGYTGDLYRRLHWEVHNAAGGSKMLVQFFYMKYGDFLQWGVGRQYGDKEGQKKWNVPPVGGNGVQGIPNPERPKYKSKPFLRREVMYHAKWLIKRLAEQYAYYGDLLIIKGLSDGMGDRSIMEKWIAENKSQLSNDFLNLARL